MSINRVLIVDDQEDNAEMLVKHFQKTFTCEVRVALSVDRAEEFLKSEEFHLVISDFEMPEKNGADLAKFLNRENIMTVLLFYTGADRPARFWSSLEYPCESVMKPHYKKLLELARSFLVER